MIYRTAKKHLLLLTIVSLLVGWGNSAFAQAPKEVFAVTSKKGKVFDAPYGKVVATFEKREDIILLDFCEDTYFKVEYNGIVGYTYVSKIEKTFETKTLIKTGDASSTSSGPKNNEVIVINNALSAAANYRLCLDFLNEEMIMPDKTDETSLFIRTEMLSIPKKIQKYQLSLYCRDGQILIKGQFKLGMTIEIYGVESTDNLEPIINKGLNGSAYKITYNAMHDFAQKLGTNITYK